ncbi:pilin [bacterium]|nr:pilin [bacterium]
MKKNKIFNLITIDGEPRYKKIIKQVFIVFCLVMILVLPYFVFAGDNPSLGGLKKVQEKSGFSVATEYTVSTIIGKIIAGFLGLLGTIFIALMLYGGYNWMTAAGDEAKVTKAKNTIRRAIIGLVITVGSYAIWNYIWGAFVGVQ